MDYNKKLIELLDDYTHKNGCGGHIDLSPAMFTLPESRLPIRIFLRVDGYEVMLKSPVMVVGIQDLTNNESMEVYTELGKMWLKPPPEMQVANTTMHEYVTRNCKLKEGDLVTVIGNESGHNIELGTWGKVAAVLPNSAPGGENIYTVHVGANKYVATKEGDLELYITEPEMSDIDKAKKTLEDAGYLGVYWQRRDVWGRANELGIELTEEQFNGVCDMIVRRHDCEQGINWDVIDWHLRDCADDEQVGDVYVVEI